MKQENSVHEKCIIKPYKTGSKPQKTSFLFTLSRFTELPLRQKIYKNVEIVFTRERFLNGYEHFHERFYPETGALVSAQRHSGLQPLS